MNDNQATSTNPIQIPTPPDSRGEKVLPPKDRAGVLVLPPLLMLAALLLMFVLRHFWPLAISHRSLVISPGVVLCALGVGIGVWGRVALLKAGTTVNPLKPSTAIVSNGAYRFTRNPLYVGMMSVFVGISFLIGTWWGLVVLCPVLGVMHYGVVLCEERYLERKFGQAYLAYKGSVRRYL